MHNTKVNIELINSEVEQSEPLLALLKSLDGILIPGGFGERGVMGKMIATQYAREKGMPYFGICLGLQVMMIEYARNVVGLAEANSSEFDLKTPHPVIHLLASQTNVSHKGGSMHLGAYPLQVYTNTQLFDIYQTNTVYERYRHRYEINNKYLPQLLDKGLVISAVQKMEDKKLVKAIEWGKHYFTDKKGLALNNTQKPKTCFGIGVQFHPEFQSSPFKPHPLFGAFIKAAIEYKYTAN
jgi:CTP synthase